MCPPPDERPGAPDQPSADEPPAGQLRVGPIRFSLLGGARLDVATDPPIAVPRLEKKTAALVAYLAVEGATTRSRIAGLLWPDSKESTARNNLAQAVRRLRSAAGAPVVVGDETVELRDATSDVAELLLAVHRGRTADAARLHLAAPGNGELLAGYDLDECSDYASWLEGTRAHLLRSWSRAANAEIDRAEREARFDDALALAERLVAAEPISEAAHLRVARLQLAKGDAPAAMSAYERCRKTLARELAMKPSAAMLEVLRAIREGKVPAATRRAAGPVALPIAVLRPRWIGRTREWGELERAFAARRGAVVSGAPGVGKSRLLREFVERKGPSLVAEGRPGDADVPYASIARTLRALVTDRKLALPAWAATEIGRVVPELSTEAMGAPSMRSKLRFLEAVTHTFRQAAEGGLAGLVVDDLQWVDAASVEALEWIAERCWTGDLPLFASVAHRDGELGAETATRIDRVVGSGLAVRIDLGPLAPDEALDLVRSLELPELEGRIASIAEASHGVPLFLLEIVRAALDGSSEDGRVTIPDRVKALVRRRLDRLGEPALRLARVAAVAGPSFDLSLAANVIGASPLDLVEPWAALEAGQVIAGGRLAHDVLAEVLREDLPGVVREHVHARIAEHLARAGADHALVAHHFEAGGRDADAAPHLLKAAIAAREMSRVAEASHLFERAARAFEAAGQNSAACEALYHLVRGPVGDEAEALAARLERLAETDRDRARARCFRAGVDVDHGRFAEGDAAARDAEVLARAAGDAMVVAKALQVRLDAALRSGSLDGVDATLAAFDAACDALRDPEGLAAAALYHGEVELARGRPADALPHVTAALEHLERWGQLLYAKARILSVAARAYVALGDPAAAERALVEADEALRDASGAIGSQAAVRIARAELALARGDAATARAAIESLAEGQGLPRDVRTGRVLRGEALLLAGAVDDAEPDLAAVAADPVADVPLRARAERGVAAVAGRRGGPPTSGSAPRTGRKASGSSSRHRG